MSNVSDRQIQFELAIKNLNNLYRAIDSIGEHFNKLGKQKTGIADSVKEEMKTAEKSVNNSIDKMNDKFISSIRQWDTQYRSFSDNFQRNTMRSHSLFDKLGNSMKHHAMFMASGAMLGGLLAVPYAIQNVAKESETLMQKLKQNLELSPEHMGNEHLLEQDLKKLKDIAAIYSVGFSADLQEVLDVMVLLSRRFKDLNEISALTHTALVLNKLDFLDLKEGANGLESIILQFGLSAKDIPGVLNDITVAVHTQNVTSQDLMQALQRSASSFHQFNMTARESIAAMAALKSETARTASTLGNTFKSVAASFSMKSAIEALDQYGIKLYETNEQGLKTMRSGANIFKELQELFGRLDAEGKSRVALAISGGKYQVNAMMAFLADANSAFSKALEEIESKSSDAMTASLLEMGLETYQIKLMQLSASLQVFGRTVGDDVLPSLKELVIGLTNGVMWLNENHEAVGKAVSGMTELAKVLLAYYIQQAAVNGVVKEGTILLRTMYMLEGNFTTAFGGMASSLRAFGAAAAATTIQLAAIYAAINVLSAAWDRYNDKTGIAGQKADLTEQLQQLESSRSYALAYSSRTGVSVDDINRTYDEQKAALTAKLNEVNAKKKEAENTALNKAQEESERAFKAMIDKAMEAAQKQADMVNKLGDKTSNKGSKALSVAPDQSKQVFRLEKGREVESLFSDARIAVDQYTMALDTLNLKQEVYGLSIESSAQKTNLMKNRINELIGQMLQYNDLAGGYEQQANDMIAANSALVKGLEEQKISWANLSKEEKESFIHTYRDYIQDEKTLLRLLSLSDKLHSAAAETAKDANRIGVDTIRVNLNDAQNIYEKQMRMISYGVEHDIYGLGRYATEEQKRVLKLREASEQLYVTQQRLNELEKQFGNESEQYQKQRIEIDKLKLSVDELSDKYYGIRQGFADMLIGMGVEGRKFNDIWRGIMSDFAREAIQRLFQVKNAQTSLLGQILGLGATTGGAGGFNFVSQYAGTGYSLAGHATGGRYDKEHIARFAEDNKPEWVIPMTEDGKKLWTEAGKELGVVPYIQNQQIANEFSPSGNGFSNDAQLSKLDLQNQLMIQQNQMLATIANNGNGGVVVMPMQADSESVFKALQQNPGALMAIIRQQSQGMRNGI